MAEYVFFVIPLEKLHDASMQINNSWLWLVPGTSFAGVMLPLIEWYSGNSYTISVLRHPSRNSRHILMQNLWFYSTQFIGKPHKPLTHVTDIFFLLFGSITPAWEVQKHFTTCKVPYFFSIPFDVQVVFKHTLGVRLSPRVLLAFCLKLCFLLQLYFVNCGICPNRYLFSRNGVTSI